MSAATRSIINIRYDGFDITRDVEFRKTRFRTGVNALAGPCSIVVRDKDREFAFETGKSLSLDVNGQRKWDGFATDVRRGYYFDGTASIEKTARFIEIRGTDVNVLFDKRFLYDPARPESVELKAYPAGTPDDEIILYYMRHYLDLRDDFITKFAIEHVGTPAQDCGDNANCIGGNAGWSWGDFMREMSRNIGSIFYIDPDRTVVYTDNNQPSAIAGISDSPGAGEVGCRDLEIDFGGEDLRNDAMVWGAGQGENHVVFARVEDSPSIDEHNRWQYGDFRESIYRQATVDKIADSAVYGSPQNKRGGKDDRVSVRCTVFDHRFRAAQKVNVRSAVYGYEDVLPIRIVDISFPTPRHVQYDLQLSHEIDPIWSTFEFFFPKFSPHIPIVSIPSLPEIHFEPPSFIDENGDVILADYHPHCVGGKVNYEGDVATDDAGNVYGFNNPGPYSMMVSMFAQRAAYPPVADVSQLGYLGWGRYLVDGSAATYLVGARRHCADQIEWDLRIPLPIRGASVVQAQGDISAFEDYPEKHMCRKMTLYVEGVPVGEWEHDPDNPVNSVVPQISLSGTVVGQHVVLACTGGSVWDIIPHEVGEGNWNTNWIVNEAALSADCASADTLDGNPGVTPPPGNPTNGGVFEPPTSETVPGSPGARCFDVGSPYWPGSSQLFIGGLFRRPGIDYYEYPDLGKFCIADGIDIDGLPMWFGATFIPTAAGG